MAPCHQGEVRAGVGIRGRVTRPLNFMGRASFLKSEMGHIYLLLGKVMGTPRAEGAVGGEGRVGRPRSRRAALTAVKFADLRTSLTKDNFLIREIV